MTNPAQDSAGQVNALPASDKCKHVGTGTPGINLAAASRRPWPAEISLIDTILCRPAARFAAAGASGFNGRFDMQYYRLFFMVCAALLAAGCATMDESECREADWRTVGLEDGSAGRRLDYIGNHRRSCADHGVKPDLEAYRDGHAIGARQFCTPANGFRQGRAGRAYAGICPADLEGGFLAAHATGHRLHDLSTEIDRLWREARQMDDDLAQMSKRSDNLEALLVSGGLSSEDRKSLLEQYRQLQTDTALLAADIRDFELEAARLQGEYDLLDASHGY